MKYLSAYAVVDILLSLPIDQYVVPAIIIYFIAKVLLQRADKLNRRELQ
jgi:hypothetical protein